MTHEMGARPHSVHSTVVGPETVLTVEQVAKLLNISIAKLRPLVARGEGPPALRVGRTYRFRPSSVARWQAEQETALAAGVGDTE